MILTIQIGPREWGADKVLHVEIPDNVQYLALIPSACPGQFPSALADVEMPPVKPLKVREGK